jgi:hypothetical protein
MHWAKTRESDAIVSPPLSFAAAPVVVDVPSLATLGELGPPQAASVMETAAASTPSLHHRWYFDVLVRLGDAIEPTRFENASSIAI